MVRSSHVLASTGASEPASMPAAEVTSSTGPVPPLPMKIGALPACPAVTVLGAPAVLMGRSPAPEPVLPAQATTTHATPTPSDKPRDKPRISPLYYFVTRPPAISIESNARYRCLVLARTLLPEISAEVDLRAPAWQLGQRRRAVADRAIRKAQAGANPGPNLVLHPVVLAGHGNWPRIYTITEGAVPATNATVER